MPTTFQLGPVALNAPVLIFIVLYALLLWAMRLLAPRFQGQYGDLRQIVDISLLAGVIAARLYFVLDFWPSFAPKPWTILFFWQGGFTLWAGIAGAVMMAAVLIVWRFKHMWKRYSIAISVYAIALMAGYQGVGWMLAQQSPQADITQTAVPAFQLATVAGEPITWQQLQGKPTVINFWATWCPPCVREMPLLADATQEYAKQGVQILAINVGERSELVANFLNEHNLNMRVLVDGVHSTESVFQVVDGRVMPTTLFVNRAGIIQSVRVGELSAATLAQGIREIQ